MTQLSAHFTLEEFDHGSGVPPESIPVLTFLCAEVLEPAREFADCPFLVTSGHRSVEANAAAKGQPNSEHIYTVDHCACDFVPQGRPTREIFDWMRMNPMLPYHQLILEHGASSTVIHVSLNQLKPGVRSVKEGATHNAEPYVNVDRVDYIPPDTREVTAE